MTKCPACGHENPPGTIFCAKCGVHLQSGRRLTTDEVPEQELPTETRSPWETREPERPPGSPLDATLVLVTEDGQEIVLPKVNTVNLGRGHPPDQSIHMVDLTRYGAFKGGVSRYHCRIHRQKTGFYIEDLLSTNGTYINKRRLPPYVPQGLRDGDEIQLGRLVLKFHIR